MNESGDQATPSKVQKLSASDTSLAKAQKALEDIDCCQTEIDSLNEKASEEILQVEQKYNKLRKPHFEKRSELINNIPNFWVRAFINHPRLASIINDEDEECLEYLTQMEVEEFEDIKSGYVMKFHFSENPYFSNDLLTKDFRLERTGNPASTSTEILWKDNMNLIMRAAKKMSSRKRRRGGGRTFFSWFKSLVEPSLDSVAEILKDELWPNPLHYYLSTDGDIEANGVSDTDDEDSDMESDDGLDDSVVVVGDDDDDDDDANIYSDDEVYEVDDDDDDQFSHNWKTVDSIALDSDEDAIEVLDSEGEAEALNSTSEVIDSPQEVMDTSTVATSQELADTSDNVTEATKETNETSKESTETSNVADTTQETTETVQQTEDTIQETTETVQQTEDAIQETTETVRQTEDAIQETTETVQQTEDTIQEKTETVQQTEDTIQEKTETVQKTEDTIQENADTTEKVNESTKELADMSQEIAEGGSSEISCDVSATEEPSATESEVKEPSSGVDVPQGDTEDEVDEGAEDELLKEDSDNDTGGGAVE